MALGGRHWDWHIGLYACARVYDYDVMNIRDMMDKKTLWIDIFLINEKVEEIRTMLSAWHDMVSAWHRIF
jgi:hypothetical protein